MCPKPWAVVAEIPVGIKLREKRQTLNVYKAKG